MLEIVNTWRSHHPDGQGRFAEQTRKLSGTLCDLPYEENEARKLMTFIAGLIWGGIIVAIYLALYLRRERKKMDTAIQSLINQAEANSNAEEAAVNALQGIVANFQNLVANAGSLSSNDRATIQAEISKMNSSASDLGAAIVSGTTASTASGTPAPTGTSPAITSPGLLTIQEGVQGDVNIVASGTPAPTLSVAGTLPAGVTFDPSTGLLSGSAAAGTAGTYSLNFTASN